MQKKNIHIKLDINYNNEKNNMLYMKFKSVMKKK